jgi:hypothetical protein
MMFNKEYWLEFFIHLGIAYAAVYVMFLAGMIERAEFADSLTRWIAVSGLCLALSAKHDSRKGADCGNP